MCIEMIKSFLCCKIFQGRSSETCGSQLVMTKISYILIGKRLSLFIWAAEYIKHVLLSRQGYLQNSKCRDLASATSYIQCSIPSTFFGCHYFGEASLLLMAATHENASIWGQQHLVTLSYVNKLVSARWVWVNRTSLLGWNNGSFRQCVRCHLPPWCLR